jgi:transcriptional regulator with XRE-family HTH domain
MELENYINELLKFAWTQGFNKASLARAAGIDPSSLGAIESGQPIVAGRGHFNPTLATLLAIENVLTTEDDIPSAPPAEWRGGILSYDKSEGMQLTRRAFLSDAIVPFVAPELLAITRYCEALRIENGGLFRDDLKDDVLKYLAPKALFHIASAPLKEKDAEWMRWDPSATILGGHKLEGKSVSFAGDSVFASEIFRDIKIARQAGIPLFHAIYRHGKIEKKGPTITRFYIRLLLRLESRNGGFEILWVTARKKIETARDFFSNLPGG